MVSIILAVYNAEKHIERTADVLLNQTYSDLEIIFVDDGSTDSSPQMLDELASREKRIFVIHQNNMGPGVARNTGLNNAHGEYVIFLDVDDLFEKDLVRTFLDKAIETSADMVICSALRYDEEFSLLKPFPGALQYNMLPYDRDCFSPEDISDRLFQITGGFVWNKFFKKSFLDKYNLRLADTYCYEDMALYCTAAVSAKKIAVSHKELVKYRVNAGLSISDNKDKYVEDLITVIRLLRKYLDDNSLYIIYEQTYLNRVLSIIVQVFMSYHSQKAFERLFYYAKESLQNEFKAHDKDYYLNENNYKILSIFYESETPLDFALKIHTRRTKASQDVFYKYWPVPYELLAKGSRVALYGAGNVGRDVYIQLKESGYCKVVLWVDSAREKYAHKGFPVRDKKDMLNEEFDILLICIKGEEKSAAVKEECINMGVPADKIIQYPEFEDKDALIRRLTENE